jgi:3-phenylpropionate/trans-cinnamate dioxygenase ferredoxin reductase subunit
MQRIVVVGAGQAGASCVAKLRSEGFTGPITLIGEEPVPPYQRPPLSKAYLLGDMALERLFLRPESYYAENGIDLHLSETVVAIDRADRKVIAGGQAIGYDHLALCTGSVPRRLPGAIGGELRGVHVVRTLGDVDEMAPACTEGRRVLIVGGGYIGLEAAAVCARLGLRVTLVEAAERILQRVAAPETSAWFADLHRSHGVTVREGTGLTRLIGVEGSHRREPDRRHGTSTWTSSSSASASRRPPRWPRPPGSRSTTASRWTARGRTSDPAIWAAGDCASFPYRGERIRLESVQNAIDQAEAVAKNLLGADEDYVPHPWFWSDQYDVKLQIAGLNTGYTDVVVRDAGAARSHWYYAGDTLLSVDAMNDPRAYMVGKRLIEMGKSPSREAVAEAETDLKALLRA